MTRPRKAWLTNGNGKRFARGKNMPGYAAEWNEYRVDGSSRHRTKTFPRKRMAAQWVKNYNARLVLKQIGDLSPIPFSEASAEYLKAKNDLAAVTRSQYASCLGMLHSIVGDIDICDITGDLIDRFIASRCKQVKPPTVKLYIRMVNTFFVWCVEQGYCEVNPVKKATKRIRATSTRQRPPISSEQLTALIDAINTEDRRIAVWLAMTTGLDRGVIETLTASMIDLDNRCIRTIRPKTGKMIVVPIHQKLTPLLVSKLSKTRPSQRLLCGLLRQNDAKDWWRRACKIAGLSGVWFRDLRAVASTRLMRDAGLSLVDAQHLLSHASPLTTAAHYHIPDPNLGRALDKLPLPGYPSSRPKKIS